MFDENSEAFDLDAAVGAAFDKVETPAEEGQPQVELEQKNTTDQGSAELAKPADEQPLEPHSRWSADDKEFFKTLPRQTQEFLLRREGDVEKNLTQKTQEIAEQRKIYENLEQVLAPRRQQFALQGGEAAVINQLLQLSDFANSDPAGFIQWIAKDRNVDLSSFIKPAGEGNTDPALQAYQERIEALEQEIKSQRKIQEDVRMASIRKELDDFRGEKDAEGNHKRPHFEQVRNEMAAFMQSGVAKDLQDAYDRAIFANPSIRQQILEQQKQVDERARLNAAKEAAAKAEKAAGVQVKTKTPAKPAAPQGTWEDTLSDVIERAYA